MSSLGFRGARQTRLVKRVDRFTGNGTWTVPAGVTYAIAHMMGGGGGVGSSGSGSGGNSSVAFASGTVLGQGLTRGDRRDQGNNRSRNGAPNTGQNGSITGAISAGGEYDSSGAGTNNFVVAGAEVTPAASISVVVGAGGAAGNGAAGGSGYVYIEYEQEVFI